MAVNFSSVIYHFLLFSTLYVLTTSQLNAHVVGSNYADVYARLMLNDFYLNLYYYFWTNSWLLPLFFSSYLLLVRYWSFGMKIASCDVIMLPLGSLLLSENCGYTWLNPGNFWSADSSMFNTLLFNSLNKYHPGLLYWVGALVIILTLKHLHSVFTAGAVVSTRQFWPNLALRSMRTILQAPTVLIFTTLFLGAWWAAQEGSWGGWWNWDPSEVFGLVLASFYLRWLHRSGQNLLCLWGNHSLLLNYFHFTLLAYFFIQLNFDLVSHNFGTRADQFVAPAHFLLFCGLFVLVAATLHTFRVDGGIRRLVNHLRTRQVVRPRNPETVNVLLSVAFTTIFYYSFAVLVNDFFWKAFAINIGNTPSSYLGAVNLIFTLGLVFTFPNYALQSVLVIHVLLLGLPLVAALLLTLNHRRTGVGTLHYNLLLFTALNVLGHQAAVSGWSSGLFGGGDPLQYSLQTTAAWNTAVCEFVSTGLSVGTASEPHWNFIYLDSSPETKNFTHHATSSYAAQSLRIGNLVLPFTVVVFDQTLVKLTALFVLIVCSYRLFSSCKLRIIF